jgi:ADP-ribose pyrophosphatase
MRKRDWRVTASSYVVDSPFLRLRKDRIELPDGTIVEDYYVRESRGFVIVFAITQGNQVLLVRQYKHGIARELLELPAGAIDPAEQPLETAIRELQEETGYTARSMEHVRSFVVDPTNSDTLAHLFIARDALATTHQNLDVTEEIALQLVSLDDLGRLVSEGTIDSVSHVASIYVVLELLRRNAHTL